MASNPWAATVARIQAAIKQTLANIARDEAALAQNPGNTRLQQQIESGQTYLAGLQQQLNTYLIEFNNFAAQPVASSGAIVGNANQARDEGANANRPPTGQEVITPTGRIVPEGAPAGTNAQATPTSESNPTNGTNANTRPLSQTQAINNQNDRLVPGPPNTQASVRTIDNAIAATGGPGAGSRGDDNTPQTPSVVVNQLNALYSANNNFITSQSNVLDDYYSYTYSLSWYLVDPVAYNVTVDQIKKNLNGYYLLAQSGGAGNSPGTSGYTMPMDINFVQSGVTQTATGPTAPVGASRSPFFNLDYYIDNLVIHTAYPGTSASGGPIKVINLSFTISEPNGFTLPRNLYNAVQDMFAKSNKPDLRANYAAGMYCMVIRFYGYNDRGELVVPITNNVGSTDPKAAVEKFIFFQMNRFDYAMGSKLMEYKIEGATPETGIGYSTNRGSIPFNAQFTGNTVKDILVGQIKQQTASQAAGDNTRNGVPIASTPPNQSATPANGPFTAGGR